MNQTSGIDWKAFAKKCKLLGEKYARNYVLKELEN